jgi:hypothetical protein
VAPSSGGGVSVSPLERRYRWLLRAYPAQYRSGRADEMLGTLLETAAPGQRRPSAREATALITGGIRARAARNASAPARASLRLAAMLACATWLGSVVAALCRTLIFLGRNGQSVPKYEVATYAGLFVATILVWFVRRELAVLVLVAVVMAGLAWDVHGLWLDLPPLVLALLTALRTERPPKFWLLWFCIPAAYLVLSSPEVRLGVARVPLDLVLLAAFGLLPLAWAVTDARPAFALALLFACAALVGVLTGQFVVLPADVYIVLSLVAGLPLLVRMARRRRRAKA